MALKILTNNAASLAVTQLNIHTRDLNDSLERLSSGMRLFKDSPADFVLADRLRADVLISTQAIRNTNDGLSMLAITDSALGEISNILQRMAELATISSNGINTVATRGPLQAEFSALYDEIQRIARTTEFNDIVLLSPTANSPFPISFQVGLDGSGDSQVSFSGVQATLKALGLGTDSKDQVYSINAGTAEEGRAAALTALEAVKAAIEQVAIQRGSVGASESRLSVVLNGLQDQRQILQQSEDSIRSVDIASEAVKMLALRVARDAAAAVFAQANQQPQLVLDLLGSTSVKT